MRELLVEQGGAAAKVDGILYATATADVPCDRRKPAPGMLLEAMELFGVTGESGRSRVTMVGDSVSDMQAAAAAGVTRVLVATGHGVGVWGALQAAGAGAHPGAASGGVTGGGAASGGVTGGSAASGGVTGGVVIAMPGDDPSRTLPPATLPLVVRPSRYCRTRHMN